MIQNLENVRNILAQAAPTAQHKSESDSTN
jgi:hypothetical protein